VRSEVAGAFCRRLSEYFAALVWDVVAW